MKKSKILIISLLFLVSIGIICYSTKEELDGETVELENSTLDLLAESDGGTGVYTASIGVKISGYGYVFIGKINGRYALCVDKEHYTTSGTVYTRSSVSTNTDANKALAYLESEKPVASDTNPEAIIKIVVAQLTAWGLYSYDTARELFYKMYKQYYGNKYVSNYNNTFNTVYGYTDTGGTGSVFQNCTGSKCVTGRVKFSALNQEQFEKWYAITYLKAAKNKTANEYKVLVNQHILPIRLAIIAATPSSTVYEWTSGSRQKQISMATPGNYCVVKNGTYYGPTGKVITEEQYNEQCTPSSCTEDCDEDEPYVCPTPTTSSDGGGGECTNTSFDDPDEWGCIAGDSTYLDTQGNDASNPYCQFYCQESVSSNFPVEEYEFDAGQYMTIGEGIKNSWGPVEFNGTRECRSYYKSGSNWVEGIDTKSFISDYNSTVSNIPTYYTNMKNAERMSSAISSMKEVDASASYHPECSHEEIDYTEEKTCYNKNWRADGWEESSKGYYSCNEDHYKTVYDKYYESTSYTKCNTNGQCWTETISGGCSRPSGDGTDWAGLYNSAVNKAKTLLNYMNQCSVMNTPYTLKPTVTLEYNSDPTYSWSGELVTDGGDSTSATPTNGSSSGTKAGSVHGYTSNCTGTDCNVVTYDCSGDYCKLTPSGTKTISNVNVTSKVTITEKSTSYRLPDNLYQFVSKLTGNAYSTIPSDQKTGTTYINLKESTLPIDTYIPSGTYRMSLSYSKIGNIINDSGHFDSLIDNIDSASSYMCRFKIKNDITGKECELDPDDPNCPKDNNCTDAKSCKKMTGIDVVYRVIKLGDISTSFPSIDADGRDPGSNWTNEDVDKYITNNRNVKGELVYNLTPLYKITLTPSVIREIRRYNAYVNDYGDFNLTCSSDETGKNCISNFIHNTVKISGKTFNFSTYFDSSATCQNITTGTFSSCADK